MSEYQGRGRGGDRGRGGRGRGRGRGDFDGQGRGRGGATFSGFQGGDDSSRGGRGDFRGGAGRGRGRPDKFAGEGIVFNPGSIPRPDPTITKLEDELIRAKNVDTLSTKMAQVKISGEHDVQDITGWFPRRPAFGTQGNNVTLWTNYFKLDITAKVALLKYTLKVERVDKYPKKEKEEKGRKLQPKAKGKNAKDDKNQGPKGRKLHSIITSALGQVTNSVPFATEFKDQVISLAPFKLPENNVVTVQYRDEGKDDVYKVEFHGPATVDLPALLQYLRTMHDTTGNVSFPKFEDVIDAISIITGYHARSNPAAAALGRSRYFPLQAPPDEKYDLNWPEYNRIIRGYFQSARPATGRIILNANVSHGVFRPKGLVSDMARTFRGDYDSLNKVLSKLRCRCKILSEDKDPKKSRIIQKVIYGLAQTRDGVGKDAEPNPPKVSKNGANAKSVQFHLRAPAPAGLRGNAYTTVDEYYKKRYGFNINPEFPVVNVGTKLKPVYMPAELVEVLDGQPVRRKTTPDETRGMINFSCRSPFANATSISTYGREVLGLDDSQFLSRFGIQVGKTLLTVQGRELPPPAILYQDAAGNRPKVVNVNEGEWNMESVRVIKPGKPIDRWFWVSIDRGQRAHTRHNDVLASMQKWVAFLQSQGIAIASNPLRCRNNQVTVRYSAADALKPLFEEMKPQDPQFVFVVLPGAKTDTSIYNDVKKLGDLEYGYLTQNVLQNNLLKNNPQLFANLGLKVNLKMGGTNHKLRDDIAVLKQGPCMVVGYDVTHPTNLPRDTAGLPSIVGMVASVDRDLSQWPATVWTQGTGVEMADKDMMKKQFEGRLKLFKERTDRLPKNIIIFRDGVSEGQFHQVLTIELASIRDACKAVYPPTDTPPKITIIVSVKRHQTRFYPTDQRNMVRSRNIKNGTVVDRGVTLATTWDFFLTAHKGLQGTSRPAHYTVLLDEVFSALPREQAANQLEKLTYELCHLFGRATKAVSICPPAYYADILCTRARVYLSDLLEGLETQSTISSNTAGSSSLPQIEIHENVAGSMFYI
ncbi:ribonuclease H-like domain-containing protein [Nemania sp. NC0429]|nr:ribonuclease H-like domain-containing protein [Nemania sp. NC0429]